MKSYSIYQVKDEAPNARYIKFSGLDLVKEMGLEITRDIYQKVYEGTTEDDAPSIETKLDELFTEFNINHPADFKGHSLSTSDVIELDGKFYYCDSYGWEEIEF